MPTILVQKQIRTETAILRQLERKLRPQARRELQKTIERFQDQLSIKAIAEAFENGGPNAVEALIDFDDLNEKTRSNMTPVYAAGVALGIKRLAPSFRKSLRGALPKLRGVNIPIRTDTASIRRFTQQGVGSLITSIDPTNRRAIRQISLQAVQRGDAPRDAAKLIRRSVGLRPDQVKSIDKFKAKLKEQGVTGARQDKLVDNFSRRKIRERSTLIANTEMSKVISQSQLAMADQMAEQGLVQRDQLFKQWIVTPGTPDDDCDQADGQTVKLDELFDLGEFGAFTGPPAHPGCTRKDTEVLTNSGWKLIQKCVPLDKILSVNIETLDAEWANIVRPVWQYVEYLTHYESNQFSLAVTDDHRHVIRYREKKKGRKDTGFWKIELDKDLPSHDFSFLNTIPKWNGNTHLSLSVGPHRFDVTDWCRFMGFYISEGCISKQKKGHMYNIIVAQQKYYDDVIDACSRVFPKVWSAKVGAIIPTKDRYLVSYFEAMGKAKDKFIPEHIKNLDTKYLRIFLDAFLMGDGSIKKGKHWKGYQFQDSRSYYTSSDRLASDIGEIILKLGNRPSYSLRGEKVIKHKNGIYKSRPCWTINELVRTTTTIEYMKIKRIKYNDYAFGIQLDRNNTYFVRHNGKVTLTGNCLCEFAFLVKA